MIKNKDLKLLNGSFFKEYELIKMGMISMNDHNLDIKIYEYGPRIYFFEVADDNSLKLFCTMKSSLSFLS